MASPRSAARLILDRLSVTSRDDLLLLEEICWQRGVLVRYERLGGAEARVVVHGYKAIITVSDAAERIGRQRFNVAHELGHVELHRDLIAGAICTTQDLNGCSRGPKSLLEQEANEFASELLLPERFVGASCRDAEPSLGSASALAESFQVSLTAAAMRLVEFSSEPCLLVFSQADHIRWFRRSREAHDIGLFPNVGDCLDVDTIAASYFRGAARREKPGRVSVRAWFPDAECSHNASLVEQSWPMPGYDAALTLIWVDEEIEEE
ncbi:MAG: ImmA/IrrE family metallo-endopeptidase [Anaerolineae bacterium]